LSIPTKYPLIKYTPSPRANADPIAVAFEAIVLANPSPAEIKVLPKAIFESVIRFSPSSKSLVLRLF
jgi:hypothetical protein